MIARIPKPPGASGAARQIVVIEAWHLSGIMSEFIEATGRMNEIDAAARMFGSVR